MTNVQSCANAGPGSACSKTKGAVSTLGAAIDALDLLRATSERLEHITAVVQSIKFDVLHNQARNVKTLADLGAFLGYDWGSYVDGQVADLQTQLDLLEVAQ
ncbi:hypothetical protein ACYZT7_04710 [Pseudomonas sp. RT4P38]